MNLQPRVPDDIPFTQAALIRALSICLALLIAGMSCPLRGEEPAVAIESLLRQLSADDFESRIVAQRKLAVIAESNPGELAARIPRADAESQARLIALLEAVFLANDNTTGETAERALHQLAHSQQSSAGQAAAVLRGASRLRESRARMALERLGAVFAYVRPDQLPDSPQRLLAPGTGVGIGPEAVLSAVLIPHDWTGTRDDLWHLQRLEHCTGVALYDCVFNNVSQLDIMDAVRDVPGIVVEQRGGYLGLSTNTVAVWDEDGVRGKPVPGGAADVAGLQNGDIIRQFNGAPLKSFAQLVDLLSRHRPGETIILTIDRGDERRGYERLEKKVTLTSWRAHINDRGLSVTAPPPFTGPLGGNVPPSPALPVPLAPPLTLQLL